MTTTTRPKKRRFATLAAIGAMIVGAIAGAEMAAAPEAVAAPATYQPSRGVTTTPGEPHNSDASGFIGQFVGSDGSYTYCIDGPAHYPWEYGGSRYGEPIRLDSFINYAGTRVSADKVDQLAWLLDHYGDTNNATTAAALQLLVWNVVDGDLPGSGSAWQFLMPGTPTRTEYDRLQSLMNTQAYSTSRVTPSIRMNGDGTATLRLNAELDYVNGGWRAASAGDYSGNFTLTNAVFAANGSTTMRLDNNVDYTIRPGVGAKSAGLVDVSVIGRLNGLVSDYHLVIRRPDRGGEYQRLIQANSVERMVSIATSLPAAATRNAAQVVVSTVTSDFVVEEGNLPHTLHDTMTVSVVQTPINENAAWPMDANGNAVPVDVNVTLYKAADDEPFVESDTVPASATKIGEDSITVTQAGEYTTPNGVQITEPGRYVWVEEIPEVQIEFPGEGQIPKVPAFRGKYGIANESTYVPYRPDVSTDSVHDTPYQGTQVEDRLTFSNYAPGAAPVDVTVRVVGPFEDGQTLPALTAANIDRYTVEQRTVQVTGNGDFLSGKFSTATTARPGTYYFVYESAGNVPENPGANPQDRYIPAFQDYGYYESESYRVAPVPTVATETSDQLSYIGATLTDNLIVNDLQDGDTMTVVSTLHGPLAQEPVEGDTVPADAPVVGQVTTEVTANGITETAGVEVTAAGYYTWTYEYTTSGTPDGSQPAPPVQDRTVYSSETSFVPEQPTVTTQQHLQLVYPGAQLSDHLVVEGLDPFQIGQQLDALGSDAPAEVEVESILVGPLTQAQLDEFTAEAEAAGTTPAFTPEFIEANTAGSVTTAVAADGTYQTDGIEVTEVGIYVFIYSSDGIEGIVPGFEDSSIYEPETASAVERITITSNVAEPGTQPGPMSDDQVVELTTPEAGTFTAGDRVSDALHVQGLDPYMLPDGITVTSTLLGPWTGDDVPEVGSTLDLDTDPIVGQVTTVVTHDGTWVTEPVTLPDDAPTDATYVWVFEVAEVTAPDGLLSRAGADAAAAESSDATDAAEGPDATEEPEVAETPDATEDPDDPRNVVLPAFADFTVYAEESIVTAPAPPVPAGGEGGGGLARTGGPLLPFVVALSLGLATVGIVLYRSQLRRS